MKSAKRRSLFHIAYDGTDFSGWQRQVNALSIQQSTEDTISKILNEKCIIHGCGRTDAGVHASQYFFHFDYDKDLPGDFSFILNKNLPDSISVFDIIPGMQGINAQLDVNRRTYRYYFHKTKDPFLQKISTLVPEDLDIGKLKYLIEIIPEYTDFKAFSITPERIDNTLCKVYSTRLVQNEDGSQSFIEISGNRFIRGMVRLLVGNLLEIGKGNAHESEFLAALQNKKAFRFSRLAYPQGLYLSSVEYPDLSISPKGRLPF